ncbi:MAG TPA: hypothetical protein VNT54_12670 [Solirubrobacteraceae bacterium]|nr:hypothetical protein [Solirubrobacteraceae bacterium]
MTSQGSPYARFRRCLASGNGALVRAAAAELPRMTLEDALAVCLVLCDSEPEVFERAIVRWHALLCRHVRGMTAREAQLALAALQALGGPAALPAARLLEELATLYDLPRAAAVLRAWSERDCGARPA